MCPSGYGLKPKPRQGSVSTPQHHASPSLPAEKKRKYFLAAQRPEGVYKPCDIPHWISHLRDVFGAIVSVSGSQNDNIDLVSDLV